MDIYYFLAYAVVPFCSAFLGAALGTRLFDHQFLTIKQAAHMAHALASLQARLLVLEHDYHARSAPNPHPQN